MAIRDEELADMNFVMSDPRGRRFVYRLMEGYGLYRSVALHQPVGILPGERLIYNAAQQEVAQGLQAEAIACDKIGRLYLTMLSEAEAKRKAKEIEDEKKRAEKEAKKKEKSE